MKYFHHFHLLVLITLSITPLYTNPMGPEQIYPLGYPSRQVTLLNKLNETAFVYYQQPDHGFCGPHVLRLMQEIIKSGKKRRITIVRNKNGTALIDITFLREGQELSLGKKVIPKRTDVFTLEE